MQTITLLKRVFKYDGRDTRPRNHQTRPTIECATVLDAANHICKIIFELKQQCVKKLEILRAYYDSSSCSENKFVSVAPQGVVKGGIRILSSS